MTKTKPLDYVCPVCDGTKKWHRDGGLCSLPVTATYGITCSRDHTICLLCKGIGRVEVTFAENNA